jgi:hypothetical protein
MGFFSSRKTDVEGDNYHVTAAMIGTTGGGGGGGNVGEKSMVKVIRSRFVSWDFFSGFGFFISDED